MQVYELNEIDQIVYELKSGRAAIVPTDTQMGLLSLNARLIYQIKKRPRHKELVRFIRDPSQARAGNALFDRLAQRFWPGALTLIVNKTSYRIPDSGPLLRILDAVGETYCSSANVTDEPPLADALDVFSSEHFMRFERDLVVVNGKQRTKAPSTIFNLDSGKIIRKGLIFDQVAEFLKDNQIAYEQADED